MSRRLMSADQALLIPVESADSTSPSSSSMKAFKNIRLPYRRTTKVAVIALLVVTLYTLLSLLYRLSSFEANRAYDPSPLSLPRKLEDGSLVYRIAACTDLDHDSKMEGMNKWRSYLRKGKLTVSPDLRSVSVDWDKGADVSLVSEVAAGGRAMELSDLVVFNKELITVDDRTGILYKVGGLDGMDSQVIPWVILADGPGNVSKPLKGEWMSVKDGSLYVGGLGKEWTTSTGEFINDHPMWVKRVSADGIVEHLRWTDNYKHVLKGMGLEWPGYMVHEAVQWSHVHRRWFFLPRRVSRERYDEKKDESRGSNVLVSVDEQFSEEPLIIRVGVKNAPSTKGFSAFQFLPGSEDTVIIALKSEEKDGSPLESYVTVFDTHGNILLPDQQLVAPYKFEGLSII